MRKAIVAGHICLDITPVFPSGTVQKSDLGGLLKPGTLIQTEAPDVHPGGTVANTGLGMKIMGADVRLMGKVGRDAFGGIIRSILEKYDAADSLIEADGETTSYSVVLAVPGIDRVFLHCPGANDTFDGTEIPESALRDAALFHFGYPPLMKKMYTDRGKALTAMLHRMKSHGIATGLDLAAVDPAGPAAQADWSEILAKALPEVDFFMPSFEELLFMLDRQKYDDLREKAKGEDMTRLLSVEDDILPLAQRCLDLGARAVLLKCGAPGLFLKTSGRMQETGERLSLDSAAWNGFSCFEKSYRVDKVLSGTGAGDTCIAAFLASLLRGTDPKTALENAAGAGALCCMAYDAISGLKPLEEIRAQIDRGWNKAQ